MEELHSLLAAGVTDARLAAAAAAALSAPSLTSTTGGK
jgi:hypothetical protein